MAQMNRSQFETWAARFANVKGPGTLTYLENSLFATMPLDRVAPVEHHVLQRIYPYTAGRQVGGIAAEYGGFSIYAPADDDICIIESVTVAIDVNQTYRVFERGIITTPFATSNALNVMPRDWRNPQTPQFGFWGTSASAAPGGWTQIGQFRVPANSSYTFYPDFVVNPGRQWLILLVNAANQAMEFMVNFTHRKLQPGELQ